MLERTGLVYCTKCGLKNEDEAKVCAKCGAPLQMSRTEGRHSSGDWCFGSHEKDQEDECFGLPNSGAVAGIIFGIIIIIVGIALFTGESIWKYIWPFIIIMFGLLVIVGALYGRRRRHY